MYAGPLATTRSPRAALELPGPPRKSARAPSGCSLPPPLRRPRTLLLTHERCRPPVDPRARALRRADHHLRRHLPMPGHHGLRRRTAALVAAPLAGLELVPARLRLPPEAGLARSLASVGTGRGVRRAQRQATPPTRHAGIGHEPRALAALERRTAHAWMLPQRAARLSGCHRLTVRPYPQISSRAL